MATPIYLVYLDEFGHVGPFVSRTDPKYKTSPLFGLGGFIIPAENARNFSAWFNWLKSSIFSYEIAQSGIPAFHWEKKGSKFFKTHGMLKYGKNNYQILKLVISKIKHFNGHIFYVGMKKYHPPELHNSTALYMSVLTESLRRVHTFCDKRMAKAIIILDENGEDAQRTRVVDQSACSMFGNRDYSTIIEPVFQAESHLYQNLQCADWLCAVLSRVLVFDIDPGQYPELDWVHLHSYDSLMKSAAVNSGFKK